LQLELVECVNSCGDPHEALYWANVFGIPKHKQPYNVRLLEEEASYRSVGYVCFVSFLHFVLETSQ
jgi:predicted transcriptional regulator